MASLTKRAVDAAKPSEKEFVIWDSELAGFGLRVKPSGTKTYLVQYRTLGGRSRRLSIGQHGVLTPDEARSRARKHLVAAGDGRDPAAEKAAEMKADDLNAVLDRYVTEHLERHNRASTQARVKVLLDNCIRPGLGRLKVKDVTREDIRRFHQGLEATPRQANLALAVLSKVFNLAEEWGVRPQQSNPCHKMRKFPETRRERFLSTEELERLGKLLQRIEYEATSPAPMVAAIRFLALTGCRLSEALTLKWSMVDTVRGCLLLAQDTTKGGARLHPIGTDALELLASLPREKDQPWVFPGRDGSSHVTASGLEHLWTRLRARIGLEDVRLHDLRHTVGTYAGQTKANSFMVRDLLGHKTTAMTDRYVNKDFDPVRKLSDQVGKRIAAALRGRPPAARTVRVLKPKP